MRSLSVTTPGAGALPPQRRSGEVFDRVRQAIIAGELRPNEPLIEADIAERLGVSRTPVRESLQRLAAAGLIVRASVAGRSGSSRLRTSP